MQNEEYKTANLNPHLLQKLKQLETEIRSATHDNIVLVAYQEKDENDSEYIFPYWQ